MIFKEIILFCKIPDVLMLNLESYKVNLEDIYFMFAGLEMSKSGVIPSRTILSAQLLKDSIVERMPIIKGASGNHCYVKYLHICNLSFH